MFFICDLFTHVVKKNDECVDEETMPVVCPVCATPQVWLLVEDRCVNKPNRTAVQNLTEAFMTPYRLLYQPTVYHDAFTYSANVLYV